VSFKELSPTNWIEADPVSAQFWRDSRFVGPVQMDADSWVRAFLRVELKPHVPREIRDVFDVARGALLYGWFFYPLFRLGEEQLYRVVEAAAAARYKQLGGPDDRPNFVDTIRWLTQAGVIPVADGPRWQAARQLRNRASHLEQQVVMPPGAVLTTLEACGHDINRLFAREPRRPT
jgi:hypothetical protein